MTLAQFEFLLQTRPETFVLFLVLILFRPLGLLFGFTLFAWGLGHGLTVRLGLAFALGLIVFWNQVDDFIRIAEEVDLTGIVLILIVDFAIGFGLGAMASAPFHALKYAGAITDTYRGENNSGLEDPSGGTLSTFSVLYFVAGSVVFCQSGGLYVMVQNLYLSYLIWPTGSAADGFAPDSWLLGVRLLQRSLLFAIAISAPLLITFLIIDFILAVAAKLAPRLSMYEHSFVYKNVAAIVCLPIIAVYLLRVADSNMGYAYDAIASLEAFIQ